MDAGQIAVVKGRLQADLTKQSNEQLLELCLLQRAHPDIYPLFVDSLNRELERRFTPEQITADIPMYSALRHLANQLASPVSLGQRKLTEMANSINRDVWFTDNRELFKGLLDQESVRAWIISNPDLLAKCLAVDAALAMMADNQAMATAIISDATAESLLKDRPGGMAIWARSEVAMTVTAKAAALSRWFMANHKDLLVDSYPAFKSLLASGYVDNEIVGDWALLQKLFKRGLTAHIKALLESAAFARRFVADEDFCADIIKDDTTMVHVATNASLLALVVKNDGPRRQLIRNNYQLQRYRIEIFKAVTAAGWIKKDATNGYALFEHHRNSVTNAPAGFVFANFYNAESVPAQNRGAYMDHPPMPGLTGQRANASSSVIIAYPSISRIDALSFNGAAYGRVSTNNFSATIYTTLMSPPEQP